jgi:hypothetical protein
MRQKNNFSAIMMDFLRIGLSSYGAQIPPSSTSPALNVYRDLLKLS